MKQTFKVVVKNNKKFEPVGNLSKYAAKQLKSTLARNHPEYNVVIEPE